MACSAAIPYRMSALVAASVSTACVLTAREFGATARCQQKKSFPSAATPRPRWWFSVLLRHRVKCEETVPFINATSKTQECVNAAEKLAEGRPRIFEAALEPTQEMLAEESNIDLVCLLQMSDVLSSVSEEGLNSIAQQACQKMWVKEGAVLVHAGHLNDMMVILGVGRLSIFEEGLPVRAMEPGEVFHETSVVEKRESRSTLKVQSEAAFILVVRRSSLLECLPPAEWEKLAEVANEIDIESSSHDFLAEAPVFKGASEDFLRACAKRLKFVSFAKDEAVFTVGDADNKGMYYIKSGEMGVYDVKGHFATIGARMWVGESMLVAGPGEKRGATIRALTYVEAYQLARDEFLKIAAEFPLEFSNIKRLSRERTSGVLPKRMVTVKKVERVV